MKVDTHLLQAKLLFEASLINEAEKLYLEVLTKYPNQPNANFNLGLITLKDQRIERSLIYFKTALEADPEQRQYWISYIDALIQAKLYEDADIVLSYGLKAGLNGHEVVSLMARCRHDDKTSSVHINMPASYVEDELISLFSEARYEEVEHKLLTLMQDYPDWLVGWKILSDTLLVQQKDARIPAKRALELNPNDAKEHCYYGLILKKEGDLKGALSAFEQAVILKPDYAAAYNNLGIVCKDMGNVEEGIRYYRQALQINPRYASCYSNLLFCLSHSENIEVNALFKEHLLFAEQYELPLKAKWPKHRNVPDGQRCLKIGFVSADFRDHSLVYFFEPILKYLASSLKLSLYAYSASVIEDQVTARLRAEFRFWNKVDALSDEAFAKRIIDDEVDILVDLDGHTSGNRLLTFALKPAPIQVSWLGYLATTGLAAMDYYFADGYLLPSGKYDSQFTEKLVQLPANAPFMPHALAPEVNRLPALTNGYITFGCFSRPSKITRNVVKLWCSLLKAIPKSKLLLGAMSLDGSYEILVNWFSQEGITGSRLIFQPRSDMATYLRLHYEVDICLDTFPSNGVTTTCHAAWMGLPTLCLEGDSLTSRGAQGVMKHLSLGDFVAKDEASYVVRGQSCVNNINQLDLLRQSLRDRFRQSLLARPDVIANGLELAFQQMWKRWCLKLPAEAIEISISE
ncbi:tetratricopeptide repeat protein [Methylotenera sp.]|uniref:O-linked N-acetylglucosamine transferase family protein n=1 Tax=Methylotenera sp. TaxID=2051956 RepID=UPI0024899186|nr:tetratricopeptide repeat protein [Methylotenera sp.]MDI1299328.1 tetratricopeptide repeat protein [Methylotenera sp.]